MFSKYLRKQISCLSLGPNLTRVMEFGLIKFDQKSGKRSNRKQIIDACRLLLRVAEMASTDQEISQVDELLNIIRQLILKIHNEDIYELQLIRIHKFILSIRFKKRAVTKGSEAAPKSSEAGIIRLFLQTIESNIFYPEIQEDFYGNLQKIYLEAIKAFLIEGQPMEALKYVKECFETFKRQLVVLMEFVDSCGEDKIKKISQNKRKQLQILFYLEHGARMVSSDIPSDQIMSAMLPRYEKLFTKTGLELDREELACRTGRTIKRAEPQNEINETDSIKEQNSVNGSSSYVRHSSVRERRISLDKGVVQSIQNSFKFIKQLEMKRSNSFFKVQPRVSLKLHSQSRFPRHSMRVPYHRHSRFQEHEECSEKTNTQLSQQVTHPQKAVIPNVKKYVAKSEESHKRGFNLVFRAEQAQRQKLKKLNPLSGTSLKGGLSSCESQMIKNGMFVVGALF